jgi:CBS domain containing-hemolysin-like protein
MVAVPVSTALQQVLELILRTGFSRIPVYDGTIDEVVGLAYAKDVLRRLHDGQADKPLAEILRPAQFMPESMRAAECLREMRKRKSHMVIVIDEYGGTAGLVTLEDLLEEIVGEIADEYDREEPNIEPLPDGDYRVNARLGIDEVNELLDVELPATEWDTIGGLLFNLVGGVPREGQEVEFQGLRLRAERVQGRRIGRVRIHRLTPPEEAEDITAQARRL